MQTRLVKRQGAGAVQDAASLSDAPEHAKRLGLRQPSAAFSRALCLRAALPGSGPTTTLDFGL